jgi:membrane-bound serine protease (ClpP class)
MLAGIYGLLFEGYNPGAIVPGVVGAICLLLALFAFQVLPVNYAGLALILLGVMLIIAEAFVPSFGALGLGGVAAFVFGSIILLDTDVPGMSIARSVIVGIALAASSLLLLMVYALMKMRRRPAVSGTESMLGNIAEVLEDFDRHGTVFINGERWNAETVAAVKHGDKVRVTKINGLVLEVTPLEP